MKKMICCFIYFVSSTSVLLGQSEQSKNGLARAFVGACVQIMPNIDRVEAAANVGGWKRIEGDAAKMLTSKENAENNKIWWAKAPDAPRFMIGTSVASFEGKKMAICTVSNPRSNAQDVETAVVQILRLGTPIANDVSGGQRLRVWSHKIDGRDGMISITDASPMGDVGISLAVMLPQ